MDPLPTTIFQAVKSHFSGGRRWAFSEHASSGSASRGSASHTLLSALFGYGFPETVVAARVIVSALGFLVSASTRIPFRNPDFCVFVVLSFSTLIQEDCF